ncbi:MAG: hypothetical protein RMX68_008470 [Aulosira sp. ZfuVER01]
MPNLLILHYFGCLSFPLFAWLLAEGVKYTLPILEFDSINRVGDRKSNRFAKTLWQSVKKAIFSGLKKRLN